MASPTSPITLGDEQRSVARSRILRAAREVLHRQGFRCTVDDVATAAGVSRRTVFRYFPTQGELLGAALREVIADFGAHLPVAPDPGERLEDWVRASVLRFHTLHHDYVGQMFWDLYADRPELVPDLADVVGVLVERRGEWGVQMAGHAWRASGRRGKPPAWLVEAITLLCSGFALKGLSVNDGSSPARTAELAAEMVLAVLDRAGSEKEQKVAHST